MRRSFPDVTQRQLGLVHYPQAARVMGLDEFAVRKRMFDTLITDLLNRRVLGIVEGRGKGNQLPRVILIQPQKANRDPTADTCWIASLVFKP